MKRRKQIIVGGILVLLGICCCIIGVLTHGPQVPSKEQVYTWIQEKGEDYAAEKLSSFAKEDLYEAWGHSLMLTSYDRIDHWVVPGMGGLSVHYDGDYNVEGILIATPAAP